MEDTEPMNFDFFTSFTEFMTEMQETFPHQKTALETFEDSITNCENQADAVNLVLAPFRHFSRNILTHDVDMFNAPLVCLGGIDLTSVYQSADSNTQTAIWQYLETLYVSGNVFLKPHKKKQFLQAVWKIKNKYAPVTQNVPPAPIDDNAINQATQSLQALFGGQGGVMGDLLGDVAKTVGDTLKNNDPSTVLKNIMSGDMSMFGSVFEDMDQKYGSRLQEEPIDQNAFIQNASQMLTQAAGQSGQNGQNNGGRGAGRGVLRGRGGSGRGQRATRQRNAEADAETDMLGGLDPMALMQMMQGMLGGLGGQGQSRQPSQQPQQPQQPQPENDIRQSPYFSEQTQSSQSTRSSRRPRKTKQNDGEESPTEDAKDTKDSL